MRKIINDELIQKVKDEAKEPGEVLLNTFKKIFEWDGERNIEPWNYEISMELAEELMDKETEIVGDRVSVVMFWMNKGPSFKDHLKRNEVVIKDNDHDPEVVEMVKSSKWEVEKCEEM